MWRRRFVTAAVLAGLVVTACERERAAQAQERPDAGGASTDTTPAEAQRVAADPAPIPTTLGVEDRGVFSDLDDEVTLAYPSWLEEQPVVVMRTPGGQRYAYIDGAFVGLANASLGPEVAVEALGEHDADGDGVPDQIDLMVGARKAELNAAPYKGGYQKLDYPGGDVPRTEGVCTDVVVRAARNAGVDLQVELHEDIRRSPRSFPMVKRPNPHIDHRRVKTLLPYFKRHWRALPTDPRDASSPWLPGDVLFMQTYGDRRPDHMGVVSDTLGLSRLPRVINNWTDGYSTSAMDILAFTPVTHRFRLKRGGLVVEPAHRGLAGVLRRQRVEVADAHRQLLLVTTPYWTGARGALRRYERRGEGWREVGEPIVVSLGAKGLGVGRGLHGDAPGVMRGGELKREGDQRAPAGLFELGVAFGPRERAPYRGEWPWRATDDRDRWVDDPRSPHYNTWQREPAEGRAMWRSAEALSQYELGLVVRHNMAPTRVGAGSAIFLHTWAGDGEPTLGCTAMRRRDLLRVLRWLDPEAHPVLLQAADEVF